MSLNQWVAAALAEKVGVVGDGSGVFQEAQGKSKGDRLVKFLRNVLDAPREAEVEFVEKRRLW